MTPTTEAGPSCTCLPLNRRLMAHLLKVTEGSVHEQGCVERAATEAASAERARLRAALEGLTGTVVLAGRGIGSVHEPTRAAVLALLEEL